ncbi:Protein CBG21556 [Caenorhabditis briggsae]|uniref:Protein CBG21556 n=1 Tax=Caenorhabditis briggsae TaxID=6238 RepID=A8Y0D3_CAEBR|nr:Protein CBG21556 [Caenorhabditis briggsae]CAP38318.1 Protein CBG21556 [Caenorhabditis briggsae]
MFQLSRCLDHDGCPVLEQFEVYARLTRNYATSLSNSTCITPETIPGIVKICNRRPRPPSDHVESPSTIVLTITQEKCKLIEKNRKQWSHYFDMIGMEIDFPVL